MTPDKELDVLDKFGGFTCITKLGTLWRRGQILKHGTHGILQSYNENSFFQNNNDVTIAYYKVNHYRYTVVLWFDNKTGKRIA